MTVLWQIASDIARAGCVIVLSVGVWGLLAVAWDAAERRRFARTGRR